MHIARSMLQRIARKTLCCQHIGSLNSSFATSIPGRRFIHSLEVSRRALLKSLQYSQGAGRMDSQIRTVDQFLAAAREGKADVSDACALLQRSYNALRGLELKEQRAQAARVGSGRILHWLWNHDKSLWNKAVDRDFADLLCWHLEPEGRGDFVHEWLRLMWPARSDRPETKQDRQKWHMEIAWTGLVQAGFVKAKLYWDSTAEAAITACAAVLYSKSAPVNVVSSMTVLSRALKSVFARPVSSAALRTYLDILKLTAGRRAQYDLPAAMLFHPTTPKIDAFLQCYESEESLERTSTWRVQAKAALVTCMIRAIYLLLLQGRDVDAQALGEIAMSLEPRAWNHRFEVYHESREDPKLEQVHLDSPLSQRVWDRILSEEKRSRTTSTKSIDLDRPSKKLYPGFKVIRPT